MMNWGYDALHKKLYRWLRWRRFIDIVLFRRGWK